MHTATAQAIVYTSMVQTLGWAYTSLRIIPLQDVDTEKGEGGSGGGGGAFSPGCTHRNVYSNDCTKV